MRPPAPLFHFTSVTTGELFSTSFAKKNFPSLGTIMICTLSESFSAMIF